MDKWIEEEGRTKEEALEKALKRMNLDEEDVEVEVVEEGKRFLGLIGGGNVKIKIHYDPLQSRMKSARRALERILGGMGLEGTVMDSVENGDIHLRVKSEHGSLLIGKKGQTIDAVQYIVSRIANRSPDERVRIVVDAEGYREKHDERIRRMAEKMASRVRSTGQPVTTPPMNPYDRRIIHMTLQNDSEVKTLSKGEGMFKRVKISLRRQNDAD